MRFRNTISERMERDLREPLSYKDAAQLSWVWKRCIDSVRYLKALREPTMILPTNGMAANE